MSSNIQLKSLSPFEKGLLSLSNKLVDPSSSPISLQDIFKSLVVTVHTTKGTKKMDSFIASLDPSYSPKLLFLAIKSIQYGFSTDKDCPGQYLEKWNKLSETQLQEKIKKIRNKLGSPNAESITETTPSGRHRARTFNVLPARSPEVAKIIEETAVERSPSSSPTSFIHRTLSKVGSFSRGRSGSSSPIPELPKDLLPPLSPKKQHSPISEVVVRTPSKEELAAATSKSTTSLTKGKEEVEEEVYFWQTGIFISTLENPSEILFEFRKDLNSFLEKEPGFKELRRDPSVKQIQLLEDAANAYLQEISCRMDKDIKNLEEYLKNIKSDASSSPDFRSVEFKRKFVACSYLIHLYLVSLLVDKIYIKNGFPKPQFVDKMETLLHMEVPLFKLIPQINKEKWPILKDIVVDKIIVNFQNDLQMAQSNLAYEYLRKVTKEKNQRFFMSKAKFDQEYRVDPLTKVGLGHRASAAELPSWIKPWMGDMIDKK